MKNNKVLKWFILAIAIAINLFILINAFLDGNASAKESNGLAQTFANILNFLKKDTITSENFAQFAFIIRKLVGHFLLFVFSGVFTTWALCLFLKDTKVGYFPWILCLTFGLGISLALISEMTQLFVDGRSGAWSDVGIDSLGYFIGVFPVILIFFLKKSPIFLKPKNKKNQAD